MILNLELRKELDEAFCSVNTKQKIVEKIGSSRGIFRNLQLWVFSPFLKIFWVLDSIFF